MGRDGHELEDALRLAGREPLVEQPLAGALGHELLGAGAGGHAARGHPDNGPGSVGERDSPAVKRVDLLGLDPRDGGGLVLGIAGRDRDLGAAGLLALADELGDVLGQRLGAEGCLAEDNLADRLVDDLLEAGHMGPLLLGAEIDVAVETRVEELTVADPDDLLDARHTRAGEPEGELGRTSLYVRARSSCARVAVKGVMASARVIRRASGPRVDDRPARPDLSGSGPFAARARSCSSSRDFWYESRPGVSWHMAARVVARGMLVGMREAGPCPLNGRAGKRGGSAFAEHR